LELWISQACFSRGLSKQLVEITKKKLPQASFYRFPQLRQFQQASPVPCFFLFASFSFFVEIATARHHDC
jgi:hypothetical protein